MARFGRPEKGSVFSLSWQNYTTYLDNEKLSVLRHSRHAFEDLEILGLGLPTVGLGKGQNILVGEARRKKAHFFPFSLLGLVQKTTCSETTWLEFSKPQFFLSSASLRSASGKGKIF